MFSGVSHFSNVRQVGSGIRTLVISYKLCLSTITLISSFSHCSTIRTPWPLHQTGQCVAYLQQTQRIRLSQASSQKSILMYKPPLNKSPFLSKGHIHSTN